MQFKDIIGQTVTANRLTEIVDSGRIGHAQLFLGDTSSGSLALAIAFLQYLHCQHRQHFDNGDDKTLRADSCGECPSCRKFAELSHSDLHFIFPSAATSNGRRIASSDDLMSEFRTFLDEKKQKGTLEEWYAAIDIEKKQGMIRDADADNLIHTLSLTSYEGGYKSVVIWMAEKMNTVFANKILKTLEEPTPNTLIILVAEEREKMLSTIISRTQLVRVPSLTPLQPAVWAQADAFAADFVAWMRQLFKLNMLSLSTWVDAMHARGREQQKQFLAYAQEALHQCFLCNNAGIPLQMDFGDEKFNASFPSMVTQRNAERLNKAFDEATFAIERNGYAKMVFMELSFNISKALKNR